MLDDKTYNFLLKALRLRFQDMVRQILDAEEGLCPSQSILDVTDIRFTSITDLLKKVV